MVEEMKISQVKTLYSESAVNEWLKLNHHLEIVNISVATDGQNLTQMFYLIHYKVNAKLE